MLARASADLEERRRVLRSGGPGPGRRLWAAQAAWWRRSAMPKSASGSHGGHGRPRSPATSATSASSSGLTLNHPALPLRRPRSRQPAMDRLRMRATAPAAISGSPMHAVMTRRTPTTTPRTPTTPGPKTPITPMTPRTPTTPGRSQGAASSRGSSAKAPPAAPLTPLTLSAHYRHVEEEEFVPSDVKPLSREEFSKRFEVGEVLGRGTTSLVRAARCRQTGELFACKVMSKSKITQRARVVEEISILKTARHQGLVRLHEVAETSDELLLLMDLALGGDLYERIVQKIRYTESETKRLMRTLLDALKYLHGQGVIHRDVKPENILLTSREVDTNIKLSDFGLAKNLGTARVEDSVEVDANLVAAAKGYYLAKEQKQQANNAKESNSVGSSKRNPALSAEAMVPAMSEMSVAGDDSTAASNGEDDHSYGGATSTTSPSSQKSEKHQGSSRMELEQMVRGRSRAYTSCGTDYYVAPEVLLGKGYGPQVDIWSAGVVMYVLLCGSPPFGADSAEDVSVLYREILIGSVSFEMSAWKDISPAAKDLIRRMLTTDPSKRVSAAEAGAHPWFRNESV